MRRALIAMAALALTGCGAASTTNAKTLPQQTAVVQAASTPNPWAANCDSQQQAALDYYNLIVAQSTIMWKSVYQAAPPPTVQSAAYNNEYAAAEVAAAGQYLSVLPPVGGGPAALVLDNDLLQFALQGIEDGYVANAQNDDTLADVPLIEADGTAQSNAMSDALLASGSCQELASTSRP
jgi:hypothetical protein